MKEPADSSCLYWPFELWLLQTNMNLEQSAQAEGGFLDPCREKMNTHEIFGRKCIAVYNQGPKYARQTIGLPAYDSISVSHKYNLRCFDRLVEMMTTFVIEFEHERPFPLPQPVPKCLPYQAA